MPQSFNICRTKSTCLQLRLVDWTIFKSANIENQLIFWHYNFDVNLTFYLYTYIGLFCSFYKPTMNTITVFQDSISTLWRYLFITLGPGLIFSPQNKVAQKLLKNLRLAYRPKFVYTSISMFIDRSLCRPGVNETKEMMEISFVREWADANF